MSGTKDWRILVYVGASDDDPNPEGTTVDFTIDGDYLLEAPRIGGQRIDVLKGGAESLSWSAVVGDFSEFFTGNMTDDAGRMNVAGRLVRAQVNVNGAGFNTVWTGRLTGAAEMEGPGKYEIRFSDERWKAADLEIYTTASTAQILPGGVKAAWKNVPAAGTARAVVGAVTATDVLITVLDRNVISPSVLELLRKDLKEDARPEPLGSDGTNGNFQNLRATIGGTVKEVVSFGEIDRDPLAGLDRQEKEEERIAVITMWLAWGTGQPSVGDEFDDLVLTMDGAPTSDTWPHHIGGADGVDIIEEIKDRYDEFGIRYDSNVFSAWDASTNPDGLVGHPLIPRFFFRIREPKDLLEWSTQRYAASGLVPFVNADGEIAPKFAFMLHDVDPTTLTEVTDSDLADAASWDFRGSEAVTVIKSRFSQSRQLRVNGLTALKNDARLVEDWAADVIETDDGASVPEFTHDNVDDVGRRPHTIDLAGGEFRNNAATGGTHQDAAAPLRFFRQQATELFDRFGDGPIYGDIIGLAALESLAPGDWFRLTASNYPVFTTGSRDGSTIVCQVLETRLDPEGPSIRFLTGGPDDQPLTAPSVALAQNTGRTKHAVDATISGLPAGADKYQLQIRVGAGGDWNTMADGTANETVTIQNLPANTSIDARVRATAINTIRSAWSTTASVTTAALTAPSTPSALASSRSIRFTWANGESDYGIMLTLDGVDYLDAPLEPGATEWTFVGLDASTMYTVGVKHVDPYGGESAEATDTATTGTASTLSAPGRLEVIQGQGSTGATFVPDETGADALPHGAGVELAWLKRVPWARTVIRYDTNIDFSTAGPPISAGQASSIRLQLPLDGVRRFFQIRHEADGFTESAWSPGGNVLTSPVVSAKPVPFETPPPGPVRVERARTVLRAAVSTDAGSPIRGAYIDVQFEPNDRVDEVRVVYEYDDGTGPTGPFGYYLVADAGETLTPGQELRHQVDQFFRETWTDIKITLIPITAEDLKGLPAQLRPEDITQTGSGVRAGLSAGGTVLAEGVAGSDITVDDDGNGQPRAIAVVADDDRHAHEGITETEAGCGVRVGSEDGEEGPGR